MLPESNPEKQALRALIRKELEATMSNSWDKLRQPVDPARPPIQPGTFHLDDGPQIQIGRFGAFRRGSVSMAFGTMTQPGTELPIGAVTFGPRGLRNLAKFATELAEQMESAP